MRLASDQLKLRVKAVEDKISPVHVQLQHHAEFMQGKVLQTFQKHKIAEQHFHSTTGYGYNDRGREALESMYAELFDAEAALVRPQFASGTHAIATALFGLLRPGDELIFATGKPYDTLQKVVGEHGDTLGTLRDWNIDVKFIDLNIKGSLDVEGILKAITERTKVIAFQRSRGYTWRPSLQISDMEKIIRELRKSYSKYIFVDNCYGEFVEEREPTAVGVDLIAGSLIKNPGGGLAVTGGYIVGTKKAVHLAAQRMTAPGIGSEVGAMLNMNAAYLQGLFLAPHIVIQALKGAVFTAALMQEIGLLTSPSWDEKRTDIIQAVRFESAATTIRFIQAIQEASPVDAHVVPEPWAMPGYRHPVIMAAGTFIQGGSLEWSADAPIREPYTAYLQGGLTYEHVKLGVQSAVQTLYDEKLL